jgi:hypothetical protein
MKFSRRRHSYCGLVGYDAVKMGWYSCNALDLYSGGARFESRPGLRISKKFLTHTKTKNWYHVHKIFTLDPTLCQSNHSMSQVIK